MHKEKLLLYSPETGPRLTYIARHLLEELAGCQLLFTRDKSEVLSSAIPAINYSTEHIPGAINICPHGLLGETGIHAREVKPEVVDGLPVLFACPGKGDISFDIFSASFYMLSRYEEYLPFRKDMHGRFPYGESMVSRYSLVEEPLVEMWTSRLKEVILARYPRLVFPARKFTFIPTIDVDVPWAYRNRGALRTIGGFIRSLVRGDTDGFRSRYRVLFKGEPDPYDTFSLIEEIHDDLGLSPLFFFHTGTWGKYDKSASAANPGYRELVARLSRKYPTGIHPSYRSFDDSSLLAAEIEKFSSMNNGNAPVRSRQHFLRLDLPGTYRMLALNGIREDYTMGWAETPGFRAGTCNPFLFYDLEDERVTSLKIFPFQIMDGSLCDYLKLDPVQAAGHASRIAGRVREASGTLITLWHNDSFSDSLRWKGWNNVYFAIAGSR
jgi:hypothetical protein